MIQKRKKKDASPKQKIKLVGKWHESLIGCPSQCFVDAVGPGRFRYVLYLRWRHSDPWEARVFQTKCNAKEYYEDTYRGDYKRSPELFMMYNVNIKEEQLDEAKQKLVEVADKWLRSHPREWES